MPVPAPAAAPLPAPSSQIVAGQFYRRPLPSPSVPFASDEGKRLFKSALAAGHAESFFPLSAHFLTQSDPSFCGLGTLAMALNALSVDPGRQWKGVWRFFDETMLDCCLPLETVQKRGISLDTFACLARCQGANIVVSRPTAMTGGGAAGSGPGTLESFRNIVKECTAMAEGKVLVVAYTRKILKQTGDGHFSPLAAYSPEDDAVLIMDVARFKYPPHWVPLPLLWEATLPVDSETGKSRGWAVLSRNNATPLLLFHFTGFVNGVAACESGANNSCCSSAASTAACAPPTTTSIRANLNAALHSLVKRVTDSLLECQRAGCCATVGKGNGEVELGSEEMSATEAELVRTGVVCFVRSYKAVAPPGTVSTILANEDGRSSSNTKSSSASSVWERLSAEHKKGALELLQALEGSRIFSLVKAQLKKDDAAAEATPVMTGKAPPDNSDDSSSFSSSAAPSVTLAHIISVLLLAWACTPYSRGYGSSSTSSTSSVVVDTVEEAGSSVISRLREEALRDLGMKEGGDEASAPSAATNAPSLALLKNEVTLLSQQLTELIDSAKQ